jgi:mRNA-degrading endonuclease toxin of MazEF toxin-antitoxin module
MDYYPRGSLIRLPDPTDAHEFRYAIVISDVNRPSLETEHTIVCLSSQNHYAASVTQLPFNGLESGRLRKTAYIMPWAIYTIHPETIADRKGTLNETGMNAVADAVEGMMRP